MDKIFSLKTIFKNNVLRITLIISISFILAIINVLNAASLKQLLDIATGDSNIHLYIGILIPIVIAFLTAFFNFSYQYICNIFKLKISQDLKESLLRHIYHIPNVEYEKYTLGDWMTRLNADVATCTEIPLSIFSLLTGALSFIISLIYALALSWQMTILIMGMSPFIILLSKFILPKLQTITQLEKEKEGLELDYLQEQLNSIDIIKTYCTYNISLKQYKNKIQEKNNKAIKKQLLSSVLGNLSQMIGFLSFILSMSLGTYLVTKNILTVGAIIGLAQVSNYIIWPFTTMIGNIGAIKSNFASKQRINEIGDIKLEDELKNNNLSIEGINCLKINDLSFSYNNQKQIIKKGNLEAVKGDMIAIIGESGAGKTTLLKLILGLYTPKEGNISLYNETSCVEGVAIRNYISYVPQTHILFSGSIKENIGYGNKDYTLKEIEVAAKLANADKFIEELPNKYEYYIENKGQNLSVGQTQRIAIARAFINKMPVIILDEPTASVDKKSEALIIDSLIKNKENCITIIISHNKEIIDICNKKYQIKENMIMEYACGDTISICP